MAGAATSHDVLADALRRAAMEERAALSEIYRATAAKLFGVCLRILGDRGEAEDALQEVYVSVWRRAGSFNPARAGAMTWLLAIARNRAIDRLRASGRPRANAPIEAAASIADEAPDAQKGMEADEERRRLLICLDELEEPARSAIRAAFFEGFTYAELAENRGVPLGTMKSWVRRGLGRLRGCLER